MVRVANGDLGGLIGDTIVWLVVTKWEWSELAILVAIALLLHDQCSAGVYVIKKPLGIISELLAK